MSDFLGALKQAKDKRDAARPKAAVVLKSRTAPSTRKKQTPSSVTAADYMNPYTIAGDRLNRDHQREYHQAAIRAINLAEDRYLENEERWCNETALESYKRVRKYRIVQALREVRSVLSKKYDPFSRTHRRGKRGKLSKKDTASRVQVFDVIYDAWQPVYDTCLKDECNIHGEPFYPSIELSVKAIAAKVKPSPRQVRRLLGEIEAAGFIRRHELPGNAYRFEVVLPEVDTYDDRLKIALGFRFEDLQELRHLFASYAPDVAGKLDFVPWDEDFPAA